MKDFTPTVAAAGLGDLRTPLSRVALAVGQLARTDLVPSQQRLVGAIAEAVEEIDARVERLLRGLLPSLSEGPRTPADADAILRPLRTRLEGVLADSGIRWTGEWSSGARLRAHPDLVRRGALALLRAATRAIPGGGFLCLRPLRMEGRGGLELLLVPGNGDAPACAKDRFDDGLASFASDHGLAIESRLSPRGFGAVLWLARDGELA